MRRLATLVLAFPVLGAAQSAQESPPQAAPPAPHYAPAPQYAPPSPHHAAPRPEYPEPHRRPERHRDSWYIGFGLGGGDGRVQLSSGTVGFDDMVYSDDRATLAMNLRVGATVSPKLLLGFDGGFIASAGEDGGYSSSVQLNHYDVGLMYFPMERGLYLRAATGLSAIVQDVEPLAKASARGFNVIGGAGYAFWLARTFNLTVNVDFARHWFRDVGVDGASSWSAWLGFDWY